MGCMSSQKKFHRYRPKIEVQGKIFVFAQNRPENQQNWNLAKKKCKMGHPTSQLQSPNDFVLFVLILKIS